MLVVSLDPTRWGRAALNALQNKADLGWAIITHPFHPFRNQKFRILKTRKVAAEDTIILQGSYRGTFAVPKDWTDQASPCLSNYAAVSPSCLCMRCLLALTNIIDQISKEGIDT